MRVKDLNLAGLRCSINGKSGQRVIFFSQPTKAALNDYWQRFRHSQTSNPDSEYWRTEDDCPLSYSSVGGLFTRLSDQLGFDVHAHRFRHSFSTLMSGKVGIFELSALLGHKSLRTTQRYTHLANKTDRLANAYQGNSPLSNPDLLPKEEKRRRGRPRSKPQ
jgi:integrase/recombinase XerD